MDEQRGFAEGDEAETGKQQRDKPGERDDASPEGEVAGDRGDEGGVGRGPLRDERLRRG